MSRPELLSAPNIPKPLHGVNPRSIMGQVKWDVLRREVYARTDNHCAACGVHKSNAALHKWLEAHEVYEIDYSKGVAEMVEIVGLCHFCHNFIHSGRLRMLARAKKVSAGLVREIMSHGVAVLSIPNSPIFSGTAELCRLVGVSTCALSTIPAPRKMAPWGAWIMRWDGVEYKGKFKTQREWERAYQ